MADVKRYGARSMAKSGAPVVQPMQRILRAASSSANALVSTGPPHTANTPRSSSARTASARRRLLVLGAARGVDELELHLAAVGLVQLVEHVGVALVGVLDLGVRVLVVDRLGDVVDDRVVLLGDVHPDLDRVRGDAPGRVPAVVLDVGEALLHEVEGHRDLAGLGVAVRERVVGDVPGLRGLVEGDGALRAARRRGRAAASAAGDVLRLVVTSAGHHHDDEDDDRDDRDDGQRSVALELAASVVGGLVAAGQHGRNLRELGLAGIGDRELPGPSDDLVGGAEVGGHDLRSCSTCSAGPSAMTAPWSRATAGPRPRSRAACRAR